MEAQKSVTTCPCCGGTVFASRYLRNAVVSSPMFAYVIILSVVRWTGHLFVDWMLLVALFAVGGAMFGLDRLLPRSARATRRDRWWRPWVIVSPMFILVTGMYFVAHPRGY
jgi:hypothetical protein